ncbi:SGNH/GDSL hydrolase family protein [Shinella sp. G-2]|uniref:SGNH/GDSL hydrolase family protein n=1 Tax=Shinella sp. G-2 TaxID=3133141 RepID=UPI003D06A78E
MKGSDGSLIDKDYLFEADVDGFIRSALDQSAMNEQVIVMGDSVIECMFVDHGERMTDHAELELRSLGFSTAVRNGGVTGATSLHILNAIINKIAPIKPRLVVLASGIMDQDCMLDPDSFWTTHPYLTPIRFDPPIPQPEPALLPDLQMGDRLGILKIIKAACENLGLPLAVATTAHRGNDAYTAARMPWIENYTARRRAVNAQTREFALSAGLRLIDVEQEFSETHGIFYDQFHLNANGAAEVGSFFGREIADILS